LWEPTCEIKVGLIDKLVVVGIVMKAGSEPVLEWCTNEIIGVSSEF
jgi:hypothetical protein